MPFLLQIVAEASALAPDALTMFLDYHFVEYFSDVEDMYNVYDRYDQIL